MESVEGSESDGVCRIGVDVCDDGLSNVNENENVEVEFLDDYDVYFDDINDRLIVSRMVSNSIIKGMVNAVSQEAAEVVASKELEIAELKNALRHNRCSYGEFDASVSSRNQDELNAQEHGVNSSPSVHDWKLDLEFRGQVETMVYCTILQSIQEDYERRLLDTESVLGLIDRFKDVSGVRHELESIHKCLVVPENGHLSSQGSQEVDFHHRKVFSSHGLASGSFRHGNGNCEESKISMPETLETTQLNHMTKDELYKYFRTEMLKMKRDHETTVQLMTEEYFALKRDFLKVNELLKERGPFAAFKKEKDFEILRSKISEAILKLDEILVDSDKLSEFCNHSRERLDNLLSENHQFMKLLSDQKSELCLLSLEASDATKKLAQLYVVEEDLHKLVGYLESSLEDARTEASISEEIWKCILKEFASLIKSECDDLSVKSVSMQEIIATIYDEALHDAEVTIKSNYGEISGLESRLSQEIYGIVFQEVLRNMSLESIELQKECLKGAESLVFLESRASKTEKELEALIEENKKLKHQVSMLESTIQVKDKQYIEVTAALEKQKQQLELLNEDFTELRNWKTQHEALLCDRDEELVLLRDKLNNCHEQIGLHKIEVAKLNDKLESSENKYRKAEEEKVIEQNKLLKEKDREHMKQMESIVNVIRGLSKSVADFELRTTESIRWHNVRLENSAFQVHSLVPKTNILRRIGLVYKQRLEKKCSSLQKAEAEVDLLGDEVDDLVEFLKKIYVALDHYSPILQYYPGIIEILKLVERKLSGKAVGFKLD